MKLLFYTTDKGNSPVIDFLNSLNPKLRSKTTTKLMLLQENGYLLSEPDVKKLKLNYKEDELAIWELRSKLGSNITRIFYFFWDGNTIVVTNGFLKKSMKTPKSEIEKARKYQADYKKRKG